MTGHSQESNREPRGSVAINILHIEDSPADAEILTETLAGQGVACRISCAATGPAVRQALGHGTFDLIISDFSLPGYDGIEALETAKNLCPDVPFIFVSGTLGEDAAVHCLRNGAVDYVLKHSLSRLGSAVQRAVAEARGRRDRKRADEKIREQAALLDHAQDAIYVTDLEYTLIYWNHGAERLYGWSSGEACGHSAAECGTGPGYGGSPDAVKILLEKNEWNGEASRIRRDGLRLVVQSRWTLVRDERGRPKSILMIDTDITEKKKIESQLLRNQRVQSIGALAGGIAHDLNNMLAPILMVADLIRNDLATEDSQHMLDTAAAAARRGAEMVKQILAFARGAGGEMMPLRIERVLKELVNLIKDTFPRSIRIETVASPDVAMVTGDSTQLQQVLLNLCLNARDAMPSGGKLRIAAENSVLPQHLCGGDILGGPESVSAAPFVRLTVEDTGCGIDAAALREIGKPFFTTKQNGKGTGLGLSTVFGIVKVHGGFWEVDSRVGEGTVFRIYLPSARKAELPLPVVPPAVANAGQGELLLVVDDEAAIREITKATLEAFNYRVVTAHDGAEAVSILRQDSREIQLVITDLSMPVMDGRTLAQEVRRINPQAKILYATGSAADAAMVGSEAAPLERFVSKPYTSEALLAAVREMLGATVSSG